MINPRFTSDSPHDSPSLNTMVNETMPMLQYLHKKLGMDTWIVARVDGEDYIALRVKEGESGIHEGQVFRFADTFCNLMLSGDAPTVAPNTDDVPCFVKARQVLGMTIGAYVGVPIRFSDGSLFGTLCAIDSHPVPETLREEMPLVELMADMIGKLLEKEMAAQAERRKSAKQRLEARTDTLTNLFNRRAWDEFAAEEVNLGRQLGLSHHILSIDVDGLKAVNDTQGHAAGDAMLRDAAEALLSAMRDSDFLARWGGDEFAALIMDSPEEVAMHVKTRMHAALRRKGISASIGVEATRPHETLEEAWAAADEKMYAEKRTHHS